MEQAERRAGDPFESRALDRIDELGDVDRDAFIASFGLFRLATQYLSALESTIHRPAGLSTAGFRVLFTVWLHDGLEPREIARLAGVSTAAVSGVLRTLDRDGLILREPHDRDRRRLTVVLTEAGEGVLRRTYADQNEFESTVFSALSVDEAALFVQLIRRVLTALSDDGRASEA